MATKIFINLPVADLKKSMDFYTAIGFNNNPDFTDESAACMVLTDEIFVMLLTHDRFKEFIDKAIGTAKTACSVINSLALESLEEMNLIADKALAAGGREAAEPKDYGFMQQRSFEDPDGHNWEVAYMDLSKLPQE